MNKKLKSLLVILLVVSMFFPYVNVRASALTSIKDAMSSVKVGPATSTHEIIFMSPTGIAVNKTLTLTFTGFNTGSVAFGDVDIALGDSNNCATAGYTEQTVAAAPTGTTWGATNATPTITITAPSSSNTLVANRCLRVKIGTNATGGTNNITNPTAGLASISIGGNFGDTGQASVLIINDDQVSVNAVVPQALTFSISASSIGFGTLTASNVRYASADNAGATAPTVAHDLRASTNATGGYSVTVKGSTLTYGLNTITAIGGSNTGIASGTEQFGVHYTATGTGSGTVIAPYAATGYAFGADATTTNVIGSASGPTDVTYFNATYIADIAALTEAGSYTTALTYVATANY